MSEKHEKYCDCLDCTHYGIGSSLYGLHGEEFSHINEKDLIKIKRMISRIMERAYRRGVQQAITLYKKNNRIDQHILENLHDYRYDNDLDISYGLDGFKSTSIERLDMEESLQEIGFPLSVIGLA